MSSFGYFYEVSADIFADQYVEIETQVSVSGVVRYDDHLIIVVPDPQAAPVVELFAGTPEIAQEIAFLAESGNEVSIAVFLKGQLLETLSAAELMARSTALLASEAQPQEVMIPAAQQILASPKTYCHQCYPAYATCVANNCDAQMPQWMCDRCDTIYDTCLETCDDCHPGETTTVDEVYVDHTFLDSYECFYKQGGFFSATYRFAALKFKRTETVTTTHADCSVSTVENISYFYQYCWWLWIDSACSFPEEISSNTYCF